MENNFKTCPNCGMQISNNIAFCGNCGYNLTIVSSENINKKSYGKKIALIIIAILIIILGIFTFFYFKNNQKGNIVTKNLNEYFEREFY